MCVAKTADERICNSSDAASYDAGEAVAVSLLFLATGHRSVDAKIRSTKKQNLRKAPKYGVFREAEKCSTLASNQNNLERYFSPFNVRRSNKTSVKHSQATCVVSCLISYG